MASKEQLISLFEKKLSQPIASSEARNDLKQAIPSPLIHGDMKGQYEVVALEIFKDKRHGQRIQLFIDRLDGQSVTADDCALVTRLLREELDKALDDYMFEVSSPGLNRPLVKPEHFIRFIGHHIHFKDEGQKRDGIIKNANNEGIELETGENIGYQRIKDAKLNPKLSSKLQQEKKNDRKKSQ